LGSRDGRDEESDGAGILPVIAQQKAWHGCPVCGYWVLAFAGMAVRFSLPVFGGRGSRLQNGDRATPETVGHAVDRTGSEWHHHITTVSREWEDYWASRATA